MVNYDKEKQHPSFERIAKLRENMLEDNIDWLVIYTADPHMSEYVSDADKAREYFSGFTGSAGTLLVHAEQVLLWTDSRYYVQAEKELDGSDIIVMRSGMDGVPSVEDYFREHIWEGQVIGVDFKTISVSECERLSEKLPNSVDLVDAARLISRSWDDKPKRVFNDIELIDESLTGESTIHKIQYVRSTIENEFVDIEESYTYVVSSLDSIMWLLNIRGNDIHCVPVAYSYLMIDRNCVYFYCNKKAVNKETLNSLQGQDIIVRDYGTFYVDLDSVASDIALIDADNCNQLICDKISSTVIKVDDYKLIPKHIKNEAEINGIKEAHFKDAIVMIRFIKKVKELKSASVNEYELGRMLDDMRMVDESCLGISFDTICAYGENAAIVHYSAGENCSSIIEKKGLLLVDSGGHYLMGTTDITRTIVLGELTDEERRCYTAVLKGNIALMNAKFKKNTRGDNLDILARMPIWECGYDYGHGTGHGVGCRLNVHESPVRISYRAKSVEMVEGIVVSNEPGIYVKDRFGIRLENLLLVRKMESCDLNQFDCLTLVPFDKEAIDIDMLSKEEIESLNSYHKLVCEMISPYLDENEQLWLREQCEEIMTNL